MVRPPGRTVAGRPDKYYHKPGESKQYRSLLEIARAHYPEYLTGEARNSSRDRWYQMHARAAGLLPPPSPVERHLHVDDYRGRAGAILEEFCSVGAAADKLDGMYFENLKRIYREIRLRQRTPSVFKLQDTARRDPPPRKSRKPCRSRRRLRRRRHFRRTPAPSARAVRLLRTPASLECGVTAPTKCSSEVRPSGPCTIGADARGRSVSWCPLCRKVLPWRDGGRRGEDSACTANINSPMTCPLCRKDARGGGHIQNKLNRVTRAVSRRTASGRCVVVNDAVDARRHALRRPERGPVRKSPRAAAASGPRRA